MKLRSPIELGEKGQARVERIKGLLPSWPKSKRTQLLEELRQTNAEILERLNKR